MKSSSTSIQYRHLRLLYALLILLQTGGLTGQQIYVRYNQVGYHKDMILHRDWLLGRNPWGTSMFTGIPRDGETPVDVHIPSRVILLDTPAGGLVDGPVYRSIYDNLLGLTLPQPDEFLDFQNDFVTYHDDIGDYSTNEPTMDGTSDAILMWVVLQE